MSNLPTVNDIAQQRELLAQQRELLMAHRNNLNYLLQQAAAYGGLPFAPLATANSIAAARAGIAQAKAALRAQSVIEPDDPYDEVSLSEGLAALQPLLRQPDVRSAVTAFHADFEAAREQIALMSAYKKLHDQFQELESLYNTIHCFIYRSGRLAPSTQLPWPGLDQSLPDFQSCINDLLSAAKQKHLLADAIWWSQRLDRVRIDLELAVETHDSQLLKRATYNLRDVLNRQLSQINDRLVSAARSLRYVALKQKLVDLHTALTHLSLNANGQYQVAIFAEGIASLDQFGAQLIRSLENHNDFQEIDNQLRRVEGVIEHDIGEIGVAWPDLRLISSKVCSGNSANWVPSLNRLSAELDAYLEQQLNMLSRDLDLALKRQLRKRIVDTFRRYRSQASRSFNQVDRGLLALCTELDRIGESLAAVLRMIA